MQELCYILEDTNCNYEVFLNLDAALERAKTKLVDWGYCAAGPYSEDYNEVFEELQSTYDNPRFDGFYVDELLWCYTAPFHRT